MMRNLVGGALLAGLLAVESASAAGELAPLDGRWRGEGIELLIDTRRMQASVDPARPFARSPLVIRNITGSMFFFSIGRDTFLARAESETLSLTRVGSTHTVQLVRVR